MQDTPERALIVTPSPRRLALAWLGAVVFLVVGVVFASGAMDHTGATTTTSTPELNAVMGTLGAVLGGLGVVVIPFQSRRPVLRVTAEGISYRDGPGAMRMVPWHRVAGLAIRRFQRQRWLVVDLVDPEDVLAGKGPTRRRLSGFNQRVLGSPVVIPTVSITGQVDGLVARIEEFRPPGPAR